MIMKDPLAFYPAALGLSQVAEDQEAVVSSSRPRMTIAIVQFPLVA